MSQYLCYDIRGIQQYIFAVPRLKYIIGGSCLIDTFDRKTTDTIAKQLGVERIFAGGGRGTFHCEASRVDALRSSLIDHVHELGLDLRIGIDSELSKAIDCAEALYTCPPDSLDGEPCTASGLFPVKPGTGQGYREDRRGVHPLVWKRVQEAKNDRLGVELLKLMRQEKVLPSDLQNDSSNEVMFMRNVSPDPVDDDVDEIELADLGMKALGSRNRWAIVAMDGNDMGNQHRAASTRFDGKPEEFKKWLTLMSCKLDDCTRLATARAMGWLIKEWYTDDQKRAIQAGKRIVLPIRPLIVGGDDVVLLCHCSFAMEMVLKLSKEFEAISRQADADGKLWLGTGGKLTISAGILYAGTSLPLAAGIRFAENLLGSAKGAGRRRKPLNQDIPSPAAVDWEQLTEGAIDTPAERRNRELRFIDGDDENREVKLTRRPWVLEDMESILTPRMDQLRKLPKSVCSQVMANLQKPLLQRCAAIAKLKKGHKELFELLEETPDGKQRGDGWSLEGNCQPKTLRTDVVDALLLLQEEHRMNQETSR